MGVFTHGKNKHGQLNRTENSNNECFELYDCFEKPNDSDKLTEMPLDFKIKSIACGYFHVLILTENNELYGCGGNSSGELGTNDKKDQFNFIKLIENNSSLMNGDEIKGIACGGYHSAFFTKNNHLYLTGQGVGGQLGFGDYKHRVEFTRNDFNFGKIKLLKCGAAMTVVLNENGEFYATGDTVKGRIYSFTKFYSNTDIVNVECGYEHVVMLDKFGQLFYSDNTSKEMIHLEMPFKIKQINSGLSFFTLLSENNELYIRKEFDFKKFEAVPNEEKKITKIEVNNMFDRYYDDENNTIQVSKMFSGLSDNLYFQSTTTMDSLYYFNGDEEKKKIKELNIPLMKETNEKFVYPFVGNDFIYVITSNNVLFEEEESTE